MGSGKSTVASILRKLGYPVLDADQIVHQILSPGGPAEAEIFRTFGEDVRGEAGALDRRALGRVVFPSSAKLAQLESIIYPILRADVAARRKSLEDKGANAAFYDVPLLFEKGMRDQFDHVLVVTANENSRRERLRARSGLTDLEFDQRMAKQMKPEDKERLASAVIRNESDEAALLEEVKRALKTLNVPSPAVS
jgi:dephospho-CoA kinase